MQWQLTEKERGSEYYLLTTERNVWLGESVQEPTYWILSMLAVKRIIIAVVCINKNILPSVRLVLG
jgi:hypothetical protein